jgi:hypothetical protein
MTTPPRLRTNAMSKSRPLTRRRGKSLMAYSFAVRWPRQCRLLYGNYLMSPRWAVVCSLPIMIELVEAGLAGPVEVPGRQR